MVHLYTLVIAFLYSGITSLHFQEARFPTQFSLFALYLKLRVRSKKTLYFFNILFFVITVHSVHSNTLRAATLGFLFPILSGAFTGKEDPAYFFCEQKEPGTVFSISDSNSF